MYVTPSRTRTRSHTRIWSRIIFTPPTSASGVLASPGERAYRACMRVRLKCTHQMCTHTHTHIYIRHIHVVLFLFESTAYLRPLPTPNCQHPVGAVWLHTLAPNKSPPNPGPRSLGKVFPASLHQCGRACKTGEEVVRVTVAMGGFGGGGAVHAMRTTPPTVARMSFGWTGGGYGWVTELAGNERKPVEACIF